MTKRVIIILSILCVAVFLIWFSCNPFQHQDYSTLSNYNILDETDAVRASDNWPLTGALDAHDPAIIQENGGAWFVFGTGTGIQVKKSSDGLAWSNTGKVFSSTPSWVGSYISNFDGNIWAPDVHYYNGQYYLYYACSSFGSNTSVIGLAVSSSLSSPNWSDKGLVIRSTSSNNYNCIDPNLVIDNSGNLWLAFGSFWSGIQIVQLDSSTMKPKSGASIKNIATRSNTACEAPFIVYRSGYYYLFESVDTCCQGVNSTYKIMYGRSTSVNGTYVDKNGTGLLSGGGTLFDSGNSQWIGPGGQSLSGTSVIAHHAYDANNNGAATLLIKNLYWDSNGWPYHN